ncbi:DUF6087 family protein [Streptomyces sp. CS7]|uniref:DUF6087 family protein n=1 Tax=Streptomyces sp. CS-7 TaxID=2906769 RepID=UPI0021B3B8EC|nr:DUF6087 family protein [Streptomyces sp. CS-7]MCT6777438.1 DUF6087 family protein [Streptomyces sp. CS-7]
MTGDGLRASQLDPEVPRAIHRWNGYAWEPHGTAGPLGEAQRLLYPRRRVAGTAPQPLRTGRGRHRKP